MGLFNFLPKSKAEKSPNDGWNKVSKPQETIYLDQGENYSNSERQRGKLVMALLPGGGNPDVSAIVDNSITPDPFGENVVLSKIASGEIGKTDYEKVLNSIRGPLIGSDGNYSEARAISRLDTITSDKHKAKLLAFANNYDVDDHWRETHLGDMAKAFSNFRNPMAFEEKVKPFMDFLEQHNPPQKCAEYKDALDGLEQCLFGKQYEYHKQIKGLIEDSKKLYGDKTPAARAETERGYEGLVKSVSTYQISRAQAREGVRARMGEKLPSDPLCEDSFFADVENGFFGVFDGAGGHKGGRLASQIGAETVFNLAKQNGEPKTPSDLANWLDEASHRVSNNPNAGLSTATVAKIIDREDGNGGKALIYAQVGDSRLYIVRKNGRADLVTKDEGYENVISNALGYEDDRVCMQTGYRELDPGDKIVLCSDGITGDREPDLMSNIELSQTVNNAGDTTRAAQALVHQARKNDDRTAIVAEV